MSFVRRVTQATLSVFSPLLKQRPVQASAGTGSAGLDEDEANQPQPPDPVRAKAEAQFSGTPLKYPNPFKRPPRVSEPSTATAAPTGAKSSSTPTQKAPASSKISPSLPPVVAGVAVAVRGVLIWQKSSLPASDVQRQKGNPTGGLRLVKAGFRVGGKLIDQTTYFRNDIFGALKWGKGRTKPYREDAYADFRVSFLGADHGQHRLQISHKPTGEAGQNNYTTLLHWGPLAQTVQKLNLVGRTVRIYAPASAGSPFTLDVS